MSIVKHQSDGWQSYRGADPGHPFNRMVAAAEKLDSPISDHQPGDGYVQAAKTRCPSDDHQTIDRGLAWAERPDGSVLVWHFCYHDVRWTLEELGFEPDDFELVGKDKRRALFPPYIPHQPLREIVGIFRRWLNLPDPGALYIVLAAYVANRLQGDPVWMMLVGGPGSGKTELLMPMLKLTNMHLASTLTEPALLSGTPAKERAKDAKGGLLREIGAFGIILYKDFTSVLSMHPETKSRILAALREVYDGAWTRYLGVDGGRKLHWSGKIGMLAGCTPIIDSHHAVMAVMGERFALYRLPDVNEHDQARDALKRAGRENQMRAELAGAVEALFSGMELPATPPELTDNDQERLINLAMLAVRCRSAVERDRFTREIESIPQAEAPARLALVLVRLLTGLEAIGVDEVERWRLIRKTALDSMPQLRRQVLEWVLEHGTGTTSQVAIAVGLPTSTARRALEDLTAHGVLDRESAGKGNADTWKLSSWARERVNGFTDHEPPSPMSNCDQKHEGQGSEQVTGAAVVASDGHDPQTTIPAKSHTMESVPAPLLKDLFEEDIGTDGGAGVATPRVVDDIAGTLPDGESPYPHGERLVLDLSHLAVLLGWPEVDWDAETDESFEAARDDRLAERTSWLSRDSLPVGPCDRCDAPGAGCNPWVSVDSGSVLVDSEVRDWVDHVTYYLCPDCFTEVRANDERRRNQAWADRRGLPVPMLQAA